MSGNKKDATPTVGDGRQKLATFFFSKRGKQGEA